MRLAGVYPLNWMSSLAPAIYAEALHNVDTPVLLTDLSFIVTDVNRAGQAFTGYDRSELVGEPVSVVAGDFDVVSDVVETLVEGETWRGEFVLQTKGGRRVYGTGSAAPIVVDGKTRGYVAVFVDTTKQRRYASTSRVLSRLLRHDLRNELNLLYGHVEEASSASDDPVVQEALARATKQIDRLVGRSERVRQLRGLLEASSDVESVSLPLDEVLERCVTRAAKRFPEATITLQPVPAVEVYADELLPTALDMLLDNAVEHNDKPTPEVVVEVVDRQTDVVLRVDDNGPGIDPEHRDMIFGRGDVDTVHHGSGIGLFLVDNIVSNYDGSVWVETSPTGGASFVIRLQHADETVARHVNVEGGVGTRWDNRVDG